MTASSNPTQSVTNAVRSSSSDHHHHHNHHRQGYVNPVEDAFLRNDEIDENLKDILFTDNVMSEEEEEDIFTLSLPGFESLPPSKETKKKMRSKKQKEVKMETPNKNIINQNNDCDKEDDIDLGFLSLPGLPNKKQPNTQTAALVPNFFQAALKSASFLLDRTTNAFSNTFVKHIDHIPVVKPVRFSYMKLALGAVVSLYVLNQKHLLPRTLSGVVSKVLFWPSMPITVGRRFGEWTSVVDENVILGGIPFGFLGMPEHLRKDFGVRGVINMCEEYKGPCKKYDMLGIEELWLPTTDHFEPSLEDLKKAVQFIKKYERRGKRVYVHCRAGHGRSAAVVFAYLLSKAKDRGVLEILDMKELNLRFLEVRDVRKTLYKQPNIIKYRTMLGLQGKGPGGSDLVLGGANDAFCETTVGSMSLDMYEELVKDYATAKRRRGKL